MYLLMDFLHLLHEGSMVQSKEWSRDLWDCLNLPWISIHLPETRIQPLLKTASALIVPPESQSRLTWQEILKYLVCKVTSY